MTEKIRLTSEDYHNLFVENPLGASIFEELTIVLGFNKDSFDADPYKNAYNCGKRAAIMYIVKRLVSKLPVTEDETDGPE